MLPVTVLPMLFVCVGGRGQRQLEFGPAPKKG